MQYFKIVGREPVRFVIEMGLGACVEEWKLLSQSLQELGGVLLYERAGVGRSKSSDAPRNPGAIAKELHALLESVNHTKPIILIAHSQGGLYAQQYIRMYPGDVKGVILIDPLSARDFVWKEQLTKTEYMRSGVDKSQNPLMLEKFSRFRLGWLVKKMMKNAPLLCYAPFSPEDTEVILNSFTNREHVKTCYQEYLFAHETEHLQDLMDKGSFPDIPLTLITHSRAFAIEENMRFGNHSPEFAARIEDMW